jgi:DNA-binding response OmpR family regulator
MPLAYSVLAAGLGAGVDAYLLEELAAEGYAVQSCVGVEPLIEILNRSLDLVLLDVPGQEELSHLPRIRAACACALVVIGPARNDRLLIEALEHGADDYVQRPYRTAELLARIRAQLRRHQRSNGVALTFGPLRLDIQGRQATCPEGPLDLTAEEFTLLTLLAARPGNSYPAEFIAAQIWGSGRRNEGEFLERVVARLRELIEPNPVRPTILGGDLAGGFWLGGAAHERHINGEASVTAAPPPSQHSSGS